MNPTTVKPTTLPLALNDSYDFDNVDVGVFEQLSDADYNRGLARIHTPNRARPRLVSKYAILRVSGAWRLGAITLRT